MRRVLVTDYSLLTDSNSIIISIKQFMTKKEKIIMENWLNENTEMKWDLLMNKLYFQCKEDAAKYILFCPIS